MWYLVYILSFVVDCSVVVSVRLELCFFFFFEQKTAYEMRISDWSSDVCSSDLVLRLLGQGVQRCLGDACAGVLQQRGNDVAVLGANQLVTHRFAEVAAPRDGDLVLPAAVMDDADQLLVRQQRRAQQHRLGSEEHTSELQSLMRRSYAVFCLPTKTQLDK